MEINISDNIEKRALKEIERLNAWFWAFEESNQNSVNTYNYIMNKTYFKFKTTLMCAVIAHKRGNLHLPTLAQQEKFLLDNRVEWERLEYVTDRVVYVNKDEPVRKKTILQKLREMI